jgi:hypothetical protein
MSEAAKRLNELKRKQRASYCAHFNGLINDRCRASVVYLEVEDRTGGVIRMPCWPEDVNRGACSTSCASFRLPTPEEIEAEERRTEELINAHLAKLEAGECPRCGKPTEPRRQVGRCIYGACGCRLGQGRLR